MSEKAPIDSPELSIGDEFVVMSRHGQSRKIVARILGRASDPATGKEVVWLDRRIHRSYETTMLEETVKWSATGAISTVLEKQSTSTEESGDALTDSQRMAQEAKERIAIRLQEKRGKIAA